MVVTVYGKIAERKKGAYKGKNDKGIIAERKKGLDKGPLRNKNVKRSMTIFGPR